MPSPQVLEPYVSSAANPITDTFCREGLWRASESLPMAFENGDDAAGAGRYGVGEPAWRLGAGQCQAGRGSRVRSVLGGMYDAPQRRDLRASAALL